jgi:hypothetical protein
MCATIWHLVGFGDAALLQKVAGTVKNENGSLAEPIFRRQMAY